MAWLRKRWRWIIASATTAALAIAIAWLFDSNPTPFLKIARSQAAAGWAQAFGTVAAIAAAYWQGQRTFAYSERKSRERALRMLGQVAGLVIETIELVAKANQELEASDHHHLAGTAAALQEKVRVFRKLAEIPVNDWPSPFLATNLDMTLEHLLEVTNGIHRLPQMVRMTALSVERWIEFVERSGVFGHRADHLLQQVAFEKQINERGPGPVVHFFEEGRVLVQLKRQPRPGYRLARWSIQRVAELSAPPAPKSEA